MERKSKNKSVSPSGTKQKPVDESSDIQFGTTYIKKGGKTKVLKIKPGDKTIDLPRKPSEKIKELPRKPSEKTEDLPNIPSDFEFKQVEELSKISRGALFIIHTFCIFLFLIFHQIEPWLYSTDAISNESFSAPIINQKISGKLIKVLFVPLTTFLMLFLNFFIYRNFSFIANFARNNSISWDYVYPWSVNILSKKYWLQKYNSNLTKILHFLLYLILIIAVWYPISFTLLAINPQLIGLYNSSKVAWIINIYFMTFSFILFYRFTTISINKKFFAYLFIIPLILIPCMSLTLIEPEKTVRILNKTETVANKSITGKHFDSLFIKNSNLLTWKIEDVKTNNLYIYESNLKDWILFNATLYGKGIHRQNNILRSELLDWNINKSILRNLKIVNSKLMNWETDSITFENLCEIKDSEIHNWISKSTIINGQFTIDDVNISKSILNIVATNNGNIHINNCEINDFKIEGSEVVNKLYLKLVLKNVQEGTGFSLQNVILKSSHFKYININKFHANDNKLYGVVFLKSNIFKSIFNSTEFYDKCMFENITFSEVDFANSKFKNCHFKKSKFKKCDFSDAVFSNCTFEGNSIFDSCNVRGFHFHKHKFNDINKNNFLSFNSNTY